MSLGEGWHVYLAESLSDTLRSGLTRSNITRWSVWNSGQRNGWGLGWGGVQGIRLPLAVYTLWLKTGQSPPL